MTNDERIAHAHQEFDKAMRLIAWRIHTLPQDAPERKLLRAQAETAIEALKAVYLDTDWFDDD